MVLEALAEAIEEVELPVDEAVLTAAFALSDRLAAKISGAVAEFDAAGLWDADGSTSMKAWLRIHTSRTSAQAKRITSTATKLRTLPAVDTAWREGRLTGGHVDAIVAIITNRTLGLFAEQQDLIVSGLVEASIHEAIEFLREWQSRAEAILDSRDPDPADPDQPSEPKRSLHLSPTLDGRGRLDADLDPEGHAVVSKALSLAQGPYTVGDEAKTPEEQRADAIVEIAQFYLDNQKTKPGGRHRPHLNVIIDLADLMRSGAGARTADGIPLSATTLRKLACDAGIHRVFTDGKSSILDYGRTTRTIPPAVYTALIVRDLGCRFPGCDRPASWTEGHHIEPWEHGGETNLTNLVLLCSKHHHRIHMKGWHLKLLPTGEVEVTLPDGRVRTSRPRAG